MRRFHGGGHTGDEEDIGCPEEEIAPGTAWENIPDDFVCPLCGVGKDEFDMETE